MKTIITLILTVVTFICISTASATFITQSENIPFKTLLRNFKSSLTDVPLALRLPSSSTWDNTYKFEPRQIFTWDSTQQDTPWMNTRHKTVDNSSSSSQTRTSPIPEPGTMLLFGTGLICLADIRRRYKELG